VEPNNYELFKHKLFYLIKNKDIAFNIGVRARYGVLKMYNHVKMCEEYDKLYTEIIK